MSVRKGGDLDELRMKSECKGEIYLIMLVTTGLIKHIVASSRPRGPEHSPFGGVSCM